MKNRLMITLLCSTLIMPIARADWLDLGKKGLNSAISGYNSMNLPIKAKAVLNAYYDEVLAKVIKSDAVQAVKNKNINLGIKAVKNATQAVKNALGSQVQSMWQSVQNHPYITAAALLSPFIAYMGYTKYLDYQKKKMIAVPPATSAVASAPTPATTPVTSVDVAPAVQAAPTHAPSAQAAQPAVVAPAKNPAIRVQRIVGGNTIGRMSVYGSLNNALNGNTLNLANLCLVSVKGIESLDRLLLIDLKQIETIDLSNNQLTEEEKELTDFIKQCPNLKKVVLTGNALTTLTQSGSFTVIN